MDITIVVPLYNEEESLPELHAWIQRVMKANNYSYEIIFVNDGSTDKSWNVIENLAEKDNNVGLKFRRNYGRALPYIVDSKKHRVTSLSLWTQTCRIRQTRYLDYTK